MRSHTGRATPHLTLAASRITDELARSAADGWLVYDFRGSNPALGRLLGDSTGMSTRRAFLFVPRVGEPRLLIHHVDAGNFARLGFAVQPYGGRDEMLARLADLLGGARRVLMEYSPGNAIPYVSRVDAGTLDMVRGIGVEVLSSADMLASVIAAWDAGDIASHERAAQALARSRDALYEALRQRLAVHGIWTEWDAQQFLAARMQAEGLEFDHAPIVAVGPHAGDPHYAPAPEVALPIARSDLVLTDLWGRETSRADGGPAAYADITWMATAASSVPHAQRRVWEAVRGARDAAVAFLEEQVQKQQPVTGGAVDRASRAFIDSAGFGTAFTHRTGHSLGWSAAHGDGVNIDDFETHDTRLLRPGAAFSIEPGIYLDDFGVRSEINVVVTTGGVVRVTTPAQRELVSLV
ncbi:MAG: M24 family metallopeptidase [Chloroflexota bacterium]